MAHPTIKLGCPRTDHYGSKYYATRVSEKYDFNFTPPPK
jgi:hypothetical protein